MVPLTITPRCSAIIKRIQRLQAELSETSVVHKRRDLKELEAYLGRVADILDEVPRAKEELEFDMTMASRWKVYVYESQKPKVVKDKPQLNTEDLDFM